MKNRSIFTLPTEEKNLATYGIPKKPPLFHNLNPNNIQYDLPLKEVTPEDIRALKIAPGTSVRLKYAIYEDQKQIVKLKIVSPYSDKIPLSTEEAIALKKLKVVPPKTMANIKPLLGVEDKNIFMHNKDLIICDALGKPQFKMVAIKHPNITPQAVAIGDMNALPNGKINVNNLSGHFKTNGPHLNDVVKTVFRNHGLKATFHDLAKHIGVSQHAKPNITHRHIPTTKMRPQFSSFMSSASLEYYGKMAKELENTKLTPLQRALGVEPVQPAEFDVDKVMKYAEAKYLRDKNIKSLPSHAVEKVAKPQNQSKIWVKKAGTAVAKGVVVTTLFSGDTIPKEKKEEANSPTLTTSEVLIEITKETTSFAAETATSILASNIVITGLKNATKVLGTSSTAMLSAAAFALSPETFGQAEPQVLYPGMIAPPDSQPDPKILPELKKQQDESIANLLASNGPTFTGFTHDQAEILNQLEKKQKEVEVRKEEVEKLKHRLTESQVQNSKTKILPKHITKVVDVFTDASVKLQATIIGSTAFEKQKKEIINKSREFSEWLGVTVDFSEHITAPSSISHLKTEASNQVYDELILTIKKAEKLSDELITEYNSCKTSIANGELTISRCQNLIKKIDEKKEKFYYKLDRLSYNLNAPFASLGANFLQGLAQIPEDLASIAPLFGIFGTVASFLAGNNQQKKLEKINAIRNKLEELNQLQVGYLNIAERNRNSINQACFELSQIGDLMKSCGNYVKPEDYRNFLTTNVQTYKDLKDKTQKDLNPYQEKLDKLTANQAELQKHQTWLEAKLQAAKESELKAKQEIQQAEQKKRAAKTKAEKKKAESEIEVSKQKRDAAKKDINNLQHRIEDNKPLLDKATEYLESERPGLDTTIGELEKSRDHWKNAEEREQEALNVETDTKEIRDWWHTERSKLLPTLTAEEEKAKNIQLAAEKIYAEFLQILDHDTQHVKTLLTGAKNLTSALEKFGFEQPGKFVEVMNISHEMYKTAKTLVVFGKKLWDCLGKEDLFSDIEKFGGFTHLLDTILSPSVNFVALGFNLIAIIAGFEPKNPVLIELRANFERLYQYLNELFGKMHQKLDSIDARINAKLDDIHQQTTSTQKKVAAIKSQITTLQKKLAALKEHGSEKTNALIQKTREQANEDYRINQRNSVNKEIDQIEQLWQQKLTCAEKLHALADNITHATESQFNSSGFSFDASVSTVMQDMAKNPHRYIKHLAKKSKFQT